MITVELDNFSLREICRSGQCFRMRETAENNTYELVAGDKYLKISQAGSIVKNPYNIMVVISVIFMVYRILILIRTMDAILKR